MIIKKFNSAFTLVEIMISLFLSVIVVFFSYTMMIASYKVYENLANASSTSNDIRFLETMLRNSIMSADDINTSSSYIECHRYDSNRENSFSYKNGIYVQDIYKLSDGKTFVSSKAYSEDPSLVSSPSSTRATLSLEILSSELDSSYSSSSVIIDGDNKRTVLKCVREIYYYENADASTTGTLKEITIGVIYDKVLHDGSVVRQNKSFCFTPRGRHV